MELVRHGVSCFFSVGGDDGGMKLLFLLLLSVGVISREDHRRMGLLQAPAGFGGGVFGGACSGGPTVRLGFLFALCETWEVCAPLVCLVWVGGGVGSSGLFFWWPGPSDNGGSPLLDLNVGAAQIRSA